MLRKRKQSLLWLTPQTVAYFTSFGVGGQAFIFFDFHGCQTGNGQVKQPYIFSLQTKSVKFSLSFSYYYFGFLTSSFTRHFDFIFCPCLERTEIKYKRFNIQNLYLFTSHYFFIYKFQIDCSKKNNLITFFFPIAFYFFIRYLIIFLFNLLIIIKHLLPVGTSRKVRD